MSAKELADCALNGNATTGAADLRRDGFASQMVDGTGLGDLVTRPLRFTGKYLFVNVALAREGELRVEAQTESGTPLAGFGLADFDSSTVPRGANSTRLGPLSWAGGRSLASLAGNLVRLRFELRGKNGHLYSFWISQSTCGESGGYVAGGGRGYTAATDTRGRCKTDDHAEPAAEGLPASWVVILVTVITLLLVRSRSRPALDTHTRVVLVTGAAAGLGRCVARRLAERGDRVVAIDMDAAALRQLESELAEDDGKRAARLIPVVADVADPAAVKRAVLQVQGSLGQGQVIDAIANFAGIIRGGPLVEDDGELELVMKVNVLGTHSITRAFFPLLRRSDVADAPPPAPTIITVCSEVSLAWMSAGFNAPYSMSKFALEA